MVSALFSTSSDLDSSPSRGHCFVFLDKTLYSHSASPPWCIHCKWVVANLMLGVTLRFTSIPYRRVEILLIVTSCYKNQDKLRPDGPLDSNADSTFTYLQAFNTFTPKSDLIDLSNARRFYSSKGDPLGVKGLTNYLP